MKTAGASKLSSVESLRSGSSIRTHNFPEVLKDFQSFSIFSKDCGEGFQIRAQIKKNLLYFYRRILQFVRFYGENTNQRFQKDL